MKLQLTKKNSVLFLLLLLLLLLLCQICLVGMLAQTTLTGKVLDQKTKAPIPYASVYVENTFTGIATAFDGSFVFEVKEGYQGNVIIRAMGYDTKVIPQSDFNVQGITIYLTALSFAIEEVEASAKKVLKDPKQIIGKAIKRIPKNMASDYTVLEGTYHQAFQDYETDKLLDASQVKVKVGLQGIKAKHKTDSLWHYAPLSDNVFWESFRYNDDALLPQYQIPDYGRDHLQCLLRMDPIRNYNEPTFDFVERLDRDFMSNHSFRLDSIGMYNGENVYCITVDLKRSIKYEQLNLIDGDFGIGSIKGTDTEPWQRVRTMYLHGIYFLELFNGFGRNIPIGKLKISTEDFGICYFEYTNGFGNDRYKYIAEYVKRDKLYYPSKLYFANKFRMSPHPDFSSQGYAPKQGLQCLMGEQYYDDLIEKYSSDSERKTIKSIISENTILTPLSETVKGYKKVPIRQIIAYSKITEEIEDTFKYKEYRKYLHHRMIDFEIPNVELTVSTKSDFYNLYYPLGDRSFLWNASVSKKNGLHYSQYHTVERGFVANVSTEIGNIYFAVPIPITSKDEYRYIFKNPDNPYIYDKSYLIKGMENIWPKGKPIEPKIEKYD